MRRVLIALSLISIFIFPFSVCAQFESDAETMETTDTAVSLASDFYQATVTDILDEGINEGSNTPWQRVRVEISKGESKGEVVFVEHGKSFDITSERTVSVGDEVVLNKIISPQGEEWFIADLYRLGAVKWIFALFFILTIIFAGKKGFTSILGLFVSIGIIVWYILPGIVEGKNPLTVSLIGGILIMIVTLFLAHGFNKRTWVALCGTSITLVITVYVAQVFVTGASLFGLGSEDAFLLQGDLAGVDIRGLLLGGIIIGVLGVLDDITTAQTAAIFELKHANSKLGPKELYKRGIRIGREHIASLVNTLAMAYVGASLPLLLLISVNLQTDFWVVANGELIVEEIIRTLVGSSALVLAVPITTLIASRYFGKMKEVEDSGEFHVH